MVRPDSVAESRSRPHIHLLPRIVYQKNSAPLEGGAEGKGTKSKFQGSKRQVLLAETKRRVVRAPAEAEPAPVQPDPAAVLDEERDVEGAVAVQHD